MQHLDSTGSHGHRMGPTRDPELCPHLSKFRPTKEADGHHARLNRNACGIASSPYVAIRCHNRCHCRTAFEPQTGNGGQDAGAQSIESSRYFSSVNRQDRNGIVEVRGSIPLSSTRYENPGSDAGVFWRRGEMNQFTAGAK